MPCSINLALQILLCQLYSSSVQPGFASSVHTLRVIGYLFQISNCSHNWKQHMYTAATHILKANYLKFLSSAFMTSWRRIEWEANQNCWRNIIYTISSNLYLFYWLFGWKKNHEEVNSLKAICPPGTCFNSSKLSLNTSKAPTVLCI